MERISKDAHNVVNIISNNRISKLCCTLDAQIKKNFKFSAIVTRPVSSNGLWCCFLIPTILLSYRFLYEVSPLYKLISNLCIGLLAYSILFILFLYMSCLILTDSYTSGCTFSIFTATIPIYFSSQYGLMLSLALSAIVVGSYSILLRQILLKCPQTFTIGEAMVVSQGASMGLITGLIFAFSKRIFPYDKEDEDTELIKTFLITVLSTVGLLVTALSRLSTANRNVHVLGILLVVAAIFASIVLHLALGKRCILNFLYFLFKDALRIRLLVFWLWLVVVATIVVVYRSEIGVKVTSATRKSFHILASLVFLSGILLDIHLITLASGIVFGVMIFIEALRLSHIKPISPALQKAFQVYADEKDVGLFAMTPIYLYVGLACPLALVPWRKGNELELLSGVLSIGIGDTAASWFGERYGANKWSGSNRTLEGTIANIGSQILTVYVLSMLQLVRCPHSVLRAGVAATVAGLAEARMEQVDNLVLPLLTILAFQLTAALS